MAIEYRYTRALDGATSDVLDSLGTPPGEGIALRAPRPDEAEKLHGIYVDAFSTRTPVPLDAATWIDKWPLHPLCVLDLSVIAFSRNTAVGYLLAYLDDQLPDEGIIGQLGVRPMFREQGLASAMLGNAMCGFETLGLPFATLNVALDNTNAIRLYERLGFSRRGTQGR